MTRGLGGYCWAEHPHGGHRCTYPPGHQGDHHDWYADRRRPECQDWPADPPPPERDH